ncbi:MAG: DUF4348 domain-containing protein [Bacteroidaceae bacterium]|nr:DUF4348 domain-containing protein [Bacteroidaceae bacterium]
MKQLFTISILGLLFCSCWHGSDSVDEGKEDAVGDSVLAERDSLILFEEEEVPMSADELFDDFFFSFTTDQRFQMQRVAFPLKCKEGTDELVISREEWKEFNRFTTQDFYSVIYERESDMEIQKDTAVNEVSVDWIYLNEDYVERYNFVRSNNGQWQLINFEKEETNATPYASFANFYAKFASDSIFQRESIHFPLHVVAEAQGDVDEGGEAHLSPEEWFQFRLEMPMPEGVMTNINYCQPSISQNRKILLVEGMSNGLYVKYKFDRTNGQWHLYEIEN